MHPLSFCRTSMRYTPGLSFSPPLTIFTVQASAKIQDHSLSRPARSMMSGWASRVIPSGNGGTTTLVAGAQRPINAANTHLALQILKRCTPELVCESGTSSNFFSHLHSSSMHVPMPPNKNWMHVSLQHASKSVSSVPWLFPSMSWGMASLIDLPNVPLQAMIIDEVLATLYPP